MIKRIFKKEELIVLKLFKKIIFKLLDKASCKIFDSFLRSVNLTKDNFLKSFFFQSQEEILSFDTCFAKLFLEYRRHFIDLFSNSEV